MQPEGAGTGLVTNDRFTSPVEAETTWRTAGSPWARWTDEQLRLLATAIIDVTREYARQVPPPRGAPFFALEYPDGDLSSLDHFAARGIFRKYESVLDLGCGFGAAARWWTAHFGCRVVGLEPIAAVAAAALLLSARARAVDQTRFLSGALSMIPCRARYFTHVWSVERLLDPVEDDRRFREIFRVLRPGGHAAVQHGAPGSEWARGVRSALSAAGFVEIQAHDIERPPLGETCRVARERLLRYLEDHADPVGAVVASALDDLYRSRGLRSRIVTQVFARRPA